jgi:hypothetical protein
MKTVLLVPMGATHARMRAAAVAAEEAGFDGVWTWDHLRDPEKGAASSVLEVWTVLSALADVTRGRSDRGYASAVERRRNQLRRDVLPARPSERIPAARTGAASHRGEARLKAAGILIRQL